MLCLLPHPHKTSEGTRQQLTSNSRITRLVSICGYGITPSASAHARVAFFVEKPLPKHKFDASTDAADGGAAIMFAKNSFVWRAGGVIPIAAIIIIRLPHDDVVRPIDALFEGLL